ncbi:hypothetical protein HZS_776 [Henneguya salminicola]|nr:hypothetical protein HZS_776 [Henneguya salminicola]
MEFQMMKPKFRIWLEKYSPSLWKNEPQPENINSRTNNCLERYNRRLGSKFQNANPNIFWFIASIKNEEHYCSNLITGILSGNIPYSVEFELNKIFIFIFYSLTNPQFWTVLGPYSKKKIIHISKLRNHNNENLKLRNLFIN